MSRPFGQGPTQGFSLEKEKHTIENVYKDPLVTQAKPRNPTNCLTGLIRAPGRVPGAPTQQHPGAEAQVRGGGGSRDPAAGAGPSRCGWGLRAVSPALPWACEFLPLLMKALIPPRGDPHDFV